MFKIYDGRDKFYQWDLDRKLIVNDDSINQVHFCNRTEECSLVCDVYDEAGLRVVEVPNILLQTSWHIRAYAYCNECYTKQSKTFEVIARTKPADYVYSETECHTVASRAFEEVEKAIVEAQQLGKLDGGSFLVEIENGTDESGNDAYRANRTNKEIYNAYASGKVVICLHNAVIYTLNHITTTSCRFVYVSNNIIRLIVIENDTNILVTEVSYKELIEQNTTLIEQTKKECNSYSYSLFTQLSHKIQVYDFYYDAERDCYQCEQDYNTIYNDASKYCVVFGAFYNGEELEEYQPLMVWGQELSFGNKLWCIENDEDTGFSYWAYGGDWESIWSTVGDNLSRILSIEEWSGTVDDDIAELHEASQHLYYDNLYGRVTVTAEDVAAAGDEGITCLTIGSDNVDLADYNDILVKFYVPISSELNSKNGLLALYASAESTSQFSGDGDALIKASSSSIAAASYFHYDRNNVFTVKTEWTNNTFHYGLVIKNGYSSSTGYAGVTNGWTANVEKEFIKSKKHYFHICGKMSSLGDFKFPAGSWIEVYGR